MFEIFFESTTRIVISVLLGIACSLIIYFQYAFTYWSKRNVPTVPPTIPFGNCGPMVLMKTSYGEHMRNMYNQLKMSGKPIGGIYLFVKPMVILLDPELVKNVMSKDFSHFHSRQTYCDEEKNPLSAHLLSISGAKWKNLRSKLTPTFSSGKMKMMFHTLVTCSTELEPILDKLAEMRTPIDIKDLTGRYTTDVIGSCAFGLECNSLKDPNNEFRTYGKRIFEPDVFEAVKVIIANYFPTFFRICGFERLPKYIGDFFMKIVRETVEYRENNNINRNDFMQLLIQLKNKGTVEDDAEYEPGKRLTMNEIAAQAFVFFLAGFETSSTTMCFTMYEMAVNQDIQDKVRREINEVLKKHEGKITYESINEMTYFEKVINESMRLHAVVPNLIRKCNEDYRVPNTNIIIEKGTGVIIPAYAFQMDPTYFPNPDLFDPERFSNDEKVKRHPYTFLPFGEGPRNCIGLRFGMLQTKVGLAALLRNHRYTLNCRTKTPLVMDPRCNIFSALGGIWLNAERV